MSTWTRMALLAAGAAAGALSTRWATSEHGKRVVGQLSQRGGQATVGAPELEDGSGRLSGRSTSFAAGQPRSKALFRAENRLASRLLRVAQDVKSAMDQREGELRQQLGMATPEQIKARHSALTARRQTQLGSAPTHDDVVDMDASD